MGGRYEQVRPVYDEQMSELTWSSATSRRCARPSTAATGAAAEAAADGEELDLFDAAALGRTTASASSLDGEPKLVHDALGRRLLGAPPRVLLRRRRDGAAAHRARRSAGAGGSRARSPRVRPLGTAVFARDVGCVTALLEAGADANGAGEGGFVPLHTAAHNGDAEIVRLLLDHGADPLRATNDGKTPLDLAREAEPRTSACACSRRPRPASQPERGTRA